MRPAFFSILIAVALSGCAMHPQQYFKTADGVRIAYDYHPIKDEKGVVILMHGLGTDYDEWYYLRGFLNKNGWSTLAFDFRGHGSSTVWEDEEVEWRNFTKNARLTMLHDAEAAYTWLGKHQNVWLVGSSFGANLALNFAAKQPEIKGVVLLTPGLNFGGVETLPAIQSYGNRPVLFAASEDDLGAIQASKMLYEKAAGKKEMLQYKEAGHGAEMMDNEKSLKKEILEWLNQNSV